MAEKTEKKRVDVKIDHGDQAFFTDNVTVLHSPSKFIIDFSQTVPRIDNIDGKMRQTFTIKHNTVILDPQFAKLLLDIMKKTPADLAGFKKLDVIFSVNGEPVTDAAKFSSYLQSLNSGSKVSFKVYRNGLVQTINVKLPDNNR